MSLLEELSELMRVRSNLKSSAMGEPTATMHDDLAWAEQSADFLRNHGQALLDSIKDSDRLNFADASFWGNSYSSDGTRHNSVRESIDHDRARSKTVDGGGA